MVNLQFLMVFLWFSYGFSTWHCPSSLRSRQGEGDPVAWDEAKWWRHESLLKITIEIG